MFGDVDRAEKPSFSQLCTFLLCLTYMYIIKLLFVFWLWLDKRHSIAIMLSWTLLLVMGS